MRIKNSRIIFFITIILAILIFLLAIYFVISCATTFLKAYTQPYLISESQRYDFMGYYIMSAAYGLFSILLALCAICTFNYSHKKLKTFILQ